MFRGITLSWHTVKGATDEHLTPLTPVHERIGALIGLPRETCARLAPQWSKTDFHSHEPCVNFSESLNFSAFVYSLS